MQRLVYTPRAYVFVKDYTGNIRDISRYSTAGNVNRRIGAASTAEITLRNPKMIFTMPDDNGNVAFHPMDPITIFLKRAPGRPVRVFTGFLDKTPFLQLYPGTITLKATCTLKRLLHTYFDPALPYTQSFLATYGWIPNSQNGTWFSPHAFNEWKTDSQKNYRDGSIGQLLFATLVNIGHWREQDIYVEALPADLFESIANLGKEFVDDAEQARDEFKSMVQRIVGSSSYGSADGTSGDLSSGVVTGAKNIVHTITQVANQMGIPPAFPVTVALIECGLDASIAQNGSGNGVVRGWYQWDTTSGPPGSYAAVGVKRSKPNGAFDLAFATQSFCEAALAWLKKDSGLRNNWMLWADHIQGTYGSSGNAPFHDSGIWGQKRISAEKMVSQWGDTGNGSDPNATGDPSATPGQGLDPYRTVRSTTKGGNKSGTSGNGLTSPIKNLAPDGWPGPGGSYGAPRSYGAHKGVDAPSKLGEAWYSITDGQVVMVNQNWANNQPMVLIKSSQQFDGYPSPLYLGYGSFQSVAVKVGEQINAGDYLGAGGTHGSGPHLHFFLADSASATNGTMNPTAFIKSAAKGVQPVGGPGNTNDGGQGSNSGLGGNGDPMNAAAIGGFFGSFELPSAFESATAVALTGEKSLMNDKPLFPFIEQLCEAGLRQFQSLPDGRFFAFYPDYFGEMNHRKPYWEIDDIEVLDGGIDLSDDPLVTHEYVVGDTTMQGNEQANMMFSSGVVTVFNAFMSTSMLQRSQARDQQTKDVKFNKHDKRALGILLDADEAAAFLNRYGARPNVDDMPMIKHPYFEFFLAYQRFMLAWSKQFLTPFSFTFMPELYPGGKVGFPDHGIQMYIDEVTHSWDYESGFTTVANLSAPSVYGKDPNVISKLPPNMVSAIIAPSAPKKGK